MPCGRLSVTPSSAAKHSCRQQFDVARLHQQQRHSPLPHTSPLFHKQHASSLPSTHTLQQQHRITSHRSIVSSQHQLLAAQSRHSSTLRIPLRRLTSARYTTLPPSAAVSVVRQSPLVHLRPSHARRHYSSRTGWLATPVHRQPDNFQTNSLQACPR